MSTVRVVKLAGLSRMERDALLQRSSTDLTRFFDTVRPIIAAVRAEGDVALARYSAATLRRCGPVAKRQLADVIDPGLPAGPSECIIFADATVHGGLAALDLLIEAEHGPDSCAWLVTTAQTVVDQALDALPAHWAQMTPQRRGFSQTVLTRRFDGCL